MLSRNAASLVLGPYIAISAIVMPEHVHEADADHSHSAVHRHFQPHAVAPHDDDHAQLVDNDEGVVFWLGNVAICQPGYQFAAPERPAVERFELTAAFAQWTSPPDYDTAPSHGPPRACLSLRAPPFSA
jgi:hypothetical protein